MFWWSMIFFDEKSVCVWIPNIQRFFSWKLLLINCFPLYTHDSEVFLKSPGFQRVFPENSRGQFFSAEYSRWSTVLVKLSNLIWTSVWSLINFIANLKSFRNSYTRKENILYMCLYTLYSMKTFQYILRSILSKVKTSNVNGKDFKMAFIR